MVDETPADQAPSAETAPKKPKYRKPPTIGQGRRRSRTVNPELEMIGQLGIQAQEILRLALEVEKDDNFRTFSDYLAFREKISEFEAFCNVIESHLKEMVSDRRQELEDRFYNLWSMIFRPSLGALTRFFDRMAHEDVLPLGGKDLLESELRALQSMRGVLIDPRFASQANKAMLTDLDKLEVVITELVERATSLPDFSQRPTVNAPPPEEAPRERPAARPSAPLSLMPQAAPRGEPARAAPSDVPNVRAVQELKALLMEYKRDKALQRYVDIDTRAVDEIERKFATNPSDPAAVVWLRQICNAWASRLHDNDKEVNRILSMIRSG